MILGQKKLLTLSISKVYSITEDKSGNLWLGLLQKGIFMQPITFKGFNYMGHKLGARNIIGSACVVSVILDSKQRIWIGTDKDGIYIYDYNTKDVKHLKENVPSVAMSLSEDSLSSIIRYHSPRIHISLLWI